MTINKQTPSVKNNTIAQIFIAFGLGIFIFILIAAIAVSAFQFKYLGKIYPGVEVQGIDLSGMNFSETISTIEENLTYANTKSISLVNQDKIWQLSPGDIGLFLDPEGIYIKAIDIGRQGSFIEKLEDQYNSLKYGVQVSPQYVFDERLAQLRIAPISEEIYQELIEAVLILNGSEILMQNGQVGHNLDIHETVSQLETQLNYQQSISIDLPVTVTHPAVMDVTEQAETIEEILQEDLYLILPPQYSEFGGPWVINQQELISMLTVELASNENGSEYLIGLDETQVLFHLTEIANEIDTDPINSRFYFDDDTREFVLVESSINGYKINSERSMEIIQSGIMNRSHLIELVVDEITPEVVDTTTAAELGITELVSNQTTFFYGSDSGRIQNIQTAAARFHGLLVPPGATFSMVENIGDISLDTGFAEALIIYNGRTVKGVGGGVCQVSTTLFRAAFFGGFPIVDRYPHAYRVYYYEMGYGGSIDVGMAGLDATVYAPIVDFSFVNDTDSWLLLETYVDPTEKWLQWKFYSTSDGRYVGWSSTGLQNIKPPSNPVYEENEELEPGEIKQVDWAVDGASVIVSRTIYIDGEVQSTDSFKTNYRSWKTVCEYGPGTENYPPPEDQQDPYSCGLK